MSQVTHLVGGRQRKTRFADRRVQLQAEATRWQAALAADERAGERQTPPFSQGPRRAQRRRPRRRPGAASGRQGYLRRPPHVDEHDPAKLPARCPHCHGRIRRQGVQLQSQVEIPRPPLDGPFTISVSVGKSALWGAPIQCRPPCGRGMHGGRPRCRGTSSSGHDLLPNRSASRRPAAPPTSSDPTTCEPSSMTSIPRITADSPLALPQPCIHYRAEPGWRANRGPWKSMGRQACSAAGKSGGTSDDIQHRQREIR
jgi:hypothetical protein